MMMMMGTPAQMMCTGRGLAVEYLRRWRRRSAAAEAHRICVWEAGVAPYALAGSLRGLADAVHPVVSAAKDFVPARCDKEAHDYFYQQQ